MNEKFKDGWAQNFSKDQWSEFFTEILNLTQNREWKSAPFTDFCLASAEMFGDGSDISKDTEHNSRCLVQFIDDAGNFIFQPISTTALGHFLERTGSTSKAMGRMFKVDTDEFISRVNTDLSVVHDYFRSAVKSTQYNTFKGKIRAFLSDNYVILPADEIFRTAKKSFEQMGEVTFLKGYTDHNFYSCCFGVENEDIKECYSELMTKAGKPTDAGDVLLRLCVTTSDTGCSGANIRVAVLGRNRVLILASHYSIEHKGKASVSAFQKNADDVFAAYQRGMTDLNKLPSINVLFWEDCMERVMSSAGISKKLIVETIAHQRDLYGPVKNGLDLYLAICEASAIAGRIGVAPRVNKANRLPANPAQIVDLEEKIATCMKKIVDDIAYYDKPLKK